MIMQLWLFLPLLVVAQTSQWNFTSTTEGWSMANNVTGQVSGGVLTINITGGDPYIVSADNLNMVAATHNKLKLVAWNKTTATHFQLMYRTDVNPTWNLVDLAVKASDTQMREYFLDLSSLPKWSGNVLQLRMDPGDNNNGQQLLIDQLAFVQQVSEWNFNTTNDGWLPANSLTGQVSAGIYSLQVTGADPFMKSPADLNLDASQFNQIDFVLQNASAAISYRVYFITSDDQNWDDNKSLEFSVNQSETLPSNYAVGMVKNPLWKGNIKQIRLDPGDGGSGQIKIDKIGFSLVNFSIDNGTILLKQDLTRGGAISYISKSGTTRSLVNISDEGRYIQQSYYAGQTVNRIAEGQSPDWSPWAWNPIQVGDAYRNRAQILEYSKTGTTTYVKCIPMLWDMNNMPAEAEMEQWSTLIGNRIHVKSRLTSHRTDNIYNETAEDWQELPAVYPISALKNLYSYFGNAPYTNATMDHPSVVNLSSGFWGVYPNINEGWMAFVDDNNWGMGIYNPNCVQWLAGMAGGPGGEATDGSTSYIAPTHMDVIKKNSVYEFEYDIIIGSLTEIRSGVYSLHSGNVPNLAPSVSLTSPLNNAGFVAPASINFAATAFDADGSIAKVDFYNGTVLLFSDNSAPYTYAWNNKPVGAYNLKAVAYDNDGASTHSAVANVTVNTSSSSDCGVANESQSLVLSCPTGQRIDSIAFASYGTPTGTCGTFQVGTCQATNSLSVVNALCNGKVGCTVSANNATFGEPCNGTFKKIAVEVSCKVDVPTPIRIPGPVPSVKISDPSTPGMNFDLLGRDKALTHKRSSP